MRYLSPVFLTTFFFVSGYLFKENCSFKKVLEQRTRTLLLPFLLLGMVMIAMGQVLTFNERVPMLDEIEGLVLQNGKNQLLWFIAALYLYSLIFYWVERLAKTSKGLFVVSIALFLLNAVYMNAVGRQGIPWHIESFGFACFYMGMGKCYKEKEAQINKYTDKAWVVATCLMVYAVLITAFDLHLSFAGSRYVVDALVVTLTGIVVLVYVSKHFLQASRFLLFVGANTLFYFAFHGKAYSLLQTIMHKSMSASLLDIAYMHDVMAFCIVILDALILILPAMFVNRYCSWLLGKGFRLWKA